jgi:hypothetical protein
MTGPAAAEAEQRLAELDGVPLTLLPVRLETRFVAGPAGDPAELRVRVYPDQVHLDAHEERLTDAEIDAGKVYWRNRWDPKTAERAWPELIRGIRPARAAWIVRLLTPSNAVGEDQPQFPPVDSRDPQLDLPLAVRAMPTRWVALGYDDAGAQVLRRWFDQPIPADLVATASLTEGPPLDGDAAVDAYLGWTSDYDAAVAAGMAVTITAADLPAGRSLAEGFGRLVVLGVDWAAGAAGGAAELARLLTVHEVSDGLGYLRPGTPTNNLDTGPAAGGTVEVADPSAPEPALDPDWSAASLLTHALGLEPGVLARLPGAADTTARVGADLVDVTWAGTLGYFADQLLAPLVDDDDLAGAREHAVRHLRPLGPLPTLRVGRQPLGVLPVVGPRATLADPFAARLGGVLRRARPIWERSVPRVPRLLRDGADGRQLEQVLLAVLRRAPWTTRIWYRRVFGPLLGQVAGGVLRVQQFQATLRSVGLLDAFGVEAQPRILPFGIHDLTRHLSIPLLGPVRDGQPPDLGYLSELRATTQGQGARAALSEPGGGNSVLAALTRFTALQELDLAAARVGRRLQPPSRDPVAWRTTEITGIGPAKVTPVSPLTRATNPVPELGGRTLPDEVARLQTVSPGDPRLGDLSAFQAALGRLAAADPALVDPALRAYLGACSHRLDAWLTSLASSQLDAVRAGRPGGTHLGGFGYVEGLRPEPTPDSLGYVLGPSLAHAATAGILRSGYLAQQATGAESLDVDLSSDRVKLALELMRGVAEGLPLAVLLGYRIERALREADLSLFILPLRTVFPLRTPPADGPGGPVESTPPHEVTDAARLLERWRSARATVIHQVQLAAGIPDPIVPGTPSDPRLRGFEIQVDRLADVYDAVADVVLAEAVHQLVAGRPERAQAATRFLDRQEPPVEPDVTASPRTIGGYVQRCLVALSAATPSPAWQALADLRAAAEPRLNAWLAALFGDPARWRFSGRSVGVAGATVDTATLALAELGLSPLSLLAAATSGSPGQPTELEERVARRLAADLDPAPGGIELLADTPGSLGLAVFTALASAAHRVLVTARPADARAFDRPDGTAAPALDAVDLERRANAAATALRSAATALDQAIAAPTRAKLATALERVSRLGVAGAVPPLGLLDGPGPVPPEALDLARDAAAVVHARLDRLGELEATTPPAEAAPAHHQLRITTAFGDGFPVLGIFRIPAASDAAKSLRPADQASLLRNDPLAPVTWMTRVARVRPELDAIWHLLVSAEAATGYDAAAFAVAQVPHAAGAAWAALPFDAARPTAEAAVVVHAPSGLGGPVGAFTVDTWTEQLPLPVETVGLSFHYDAPSNRAPQAAILAVPPEVTDHPWNLDLIADTVREAFDLASIRGVTLHDLPALGAVLPALYLPFDPGGNVPSVDLDRLVGRLGPSTMVLGKD